MPEAEKIQVSLRDIVAISPNVVFQFVDGEAVLLNFQSGVYFDLNGTGTDIWKILSEDGSLASAHSRLAEKYAIDPQLIEDDLLVLTSALVANGLVTIVRHK